MGIQTPLSRNHIYNLLEDGECCASLEWASQSRRSCRSVSVWTESVTLSKPSRSLFAFRFGGLRQRNGGCECEAIVTTASIVNRKKTLNEELVAEDETKRCGEFGLVKNLLCDFDFFFLQYLPLIFKREFCV